MRLKHAAFVLITSVLEESLERAKDAVSGRESTDIRTQRNDPENGDWRRRIPDVDELLDTSSIFVGYRVAGDDPIRTESCSRLVPRD